MRRATSRVLGFLCILLPLPATLAGESAGIGVLGDSYSDEYQFYLPDRSTSRNWVEILAATRGLDFGRYTDSRRSEPRNQGFAYNWARSDATTEDLIATGQHTGVARQVAAGELKYVVVFIGGNDFIHALESADPAGALDRALPRALASYRLAVETILDASPDIRLVTATVPDIKNLPTFQDAYRQGRLSLALLERSTAAIARYNAQIRSLGLSHPRVAVADFDLMTRLANRISRDEAVILGKKLDRVHSRNDLGHLFLADKRHLGTLGQGFMAQMFIHALNVKFAAGIAPLSDKDVLEFAASLAPPERASRSLAELGTRSSLEGSPSRSAP